MKKYKVTVNGRYLKEKDPNDLLLRSYFIIEVYFKDAEPEEKKEACPVVKEEKVKKVGRWRLKLGTTIPNLLIEAFCTVTRTDPGPQVRVTRAGRTIIRVNGQGRVVKATL